MNNPWDSQVCFSTDECVFLSAYAEHKMTKYWQRLKQHYNRFMGSATPHCQSLSFVSCVKPVKGQQTCQKASSSNKSGKNRLVSQPDVVWLCAELWAAAPSKCPHEVTWVNSEAPTLGLQVWTAFVLRLRETQWFINMNTRVVKAFSWAQKKRIYLAHQCESTLWELN